MPSEKSDKPAADDSKTQDDKEWEKILENVAKRKQELDRMAEVVKNVRYDLAAASVTLNATIKEIVKMEQELAEDD